MEWLSLTPSYYYHGANVNQHAISNCESISNNNSPLFNFTSMSRSDFEDNDLSRIGFCLYLNLSMKELGAIRYDDSLYLGD